MADMKAWSVAYPKGGGRQSAWDIAAASLPTLGKVLTRGNCRTHGENISLNRVGKCTRCMNEVARKSAGPQLVLNLDW